MGGMGVVVSAYDCTLDRKVAIKVLRPDRLARDPEEGRSRLLREAQAMARLSHPNVITVHEVGTVGDQVFVAMELVDGETLSGWLVRAPRTWREIVRAFVQAGRGLAAAHEAGLVHRDFKPDNVLVGAGGEIRVTDFGLAGMSADSTPMPAPMDAEGMLAAPLTRTGSVLGTPAYMSPEQHRGAAADARSDQFSFCVALYEALYGIRPFAGESAPTILDAIEARRLAGPLRDAPRWLRPVVVRGLAPAREERWPSMEALLDALARDPAAARRRWLLWAGGVAAAAGVAALSGFYASSGGPAPCQGAAARAAAVWDAPARERVRAAFLATGTPIAADVFARVDRLLGARLAGWAAGYSDACQATRVRGEQSEAMLDLRMQCLERARRQIGSLVDLWQRQPVELDRAIDASSEVGDSAACADTEALTMPMAPPRDPAVVRKIDQVRAKLDAAQAHQRAGQVTTGLALAREAVAAARALDHPPILAEALYQNAILECDTGKMDDGVQLFYEAARAAAEAHDDVLHARILSDLVFEMGDKAERVEEGSRVSTFAEVAVARAGNRDELVAGLLWAQAALLGEQGKYEEALARLRRALPIQEKRLGPDHPDVARVLHSIAFNTEMLGRLDESLAIYRRVLAMRERTFGPDHPTIASTLNNIAGVVLDKGDIAEASRDDERALAIREKAYPPGHRYIAQSLNNLAGVRQSQGREAEARRLYERAEAIRVAALGPDHPETLTTRINLALVAVNQKDTATAKRLLEAVIPVATRLYGENHMKVAYAWRNLGLAYLEEKNWPKAEEAFSRALAIRRRQGGDPPEVAETLLNLGDVRIGQRRHADAIPLLEEARAVDERVRGPKSRFRIEILPSLGEAYLGAGRVAQAVAVLERAAAAADERPAAESTRSHIRFVLARALWASGGARARGRALALARAARDALAADPESRDERERVARWLAGRGRR